MVDEEDVVISIQIGGIQFALYIQQSCSLEDWVQVKSEPIITNSYLNQGKSILINSSEDIGSKSILFKNSKCCHGTKRANIHIILGVEKGNPTKESIWDSDIENWEKNHIFSQARGWPKIVRILVFLFEKMRSKWLDRLWEFSLTKFRPQDSWEAFNFYEESIMKCVMG